MSDMRKVIARRPKDQRLRLALRVTGFAVVLVSMFFLMKSITLDPTVNGFFAVSAGIGFVILVAGWIPGDEPVVRYRVHAQPATRRLRGAVVHSPVSGGR